jgi:hypothetical protein
LFPLPAPSTAVENEQPCSFSRTVVVSHNQRPLVPPAPSTAVENEQIRLFSRTVVVLQHHHQVPPSKTSNSARFTTITFHRPRKRAYVLVFNDGTYSPTPPSNLTYIPFDTTQRGGLIPPRHSLFDLMQHTALHDKDSDKGWA